MAYVDGFVIPVPKKKLAACILYKSRAHRDKVNAKVMKNPRIAGLCDPKDMPFDCKRMLHGGFNLIVGSQRK